MRPRGYLQIERGEEGKIDPAEKIGSRGGDQSDPGAGPVVMAPVSTSGTGGGCGDGWEKRR